ncbi:MAG: metalloregulator ArsR/SmtB family transcription factor [Pseudomonadota bacterium]
MTKRKDERTALVATAIGHERRVRLLRVLGAAREGLSFEDLLAQSGLHLSTLSHHLRPMRAAGLITTQRRGHRVIYRLREDPLTAALADLRGVLEGSVQAKPPRARDL